MEIVPLAGEPERKVGVADDKQAVDFSLGSGSGGAARFAGQVRVAGFNGELKGPIALLLTGMEKGRYG